MSEVKTEVIPGENGEQKIVHEVFEPGPAILTKRIIETKKPVVVDRETQEIENNQVVKTERESAFPEVKMELREVVKYQAPEGEEEGHWLSKEEVQEIVNEAVTEAIEQQTRSLLKNIQNLSEKNLAAQPMALVGAETVKKISWWNFVGIAIILLQFAAIVYIMW